MSVALADGAFQPLQHPALSGLKEKGCALHLNHKPCIASIIKALATGMRFRCVPGSVFNQRQQLTLIFGNIR